MIIEKLLNSNNKQNVFFNGINQNIREENFIFFIDLLFNNKNVILSKNIKKNLEEIKLKEFLTFLNNFWKCNKNKIILSVKIYK
jgi:hypothetical protein